MRNVVAVLAVVLAVVLVVVLVLLVVPSSLRCPHPSVLGHAAREPFSPDANVALNPLGESAINTACTVDVSDQPGGQYRVRGFTYLERHPTARNACVFRDNAYDVGLMDESFSQCSRAGYLHDDAVVDSIGVSEHDVPGEGRRMCVLKFKAPLRADQMTRYETAVRDRAIRLSPAFKALEDRKRGLEAEAASLGEEAKGLRDQTVEQSRKADALEAGRRDLEAQNERLQREIDDAIALRTSKNSSLQAILSENSALTDEWRRAEDAAARANAQVSEMQGRVEEARKNLEQVRAQAAAKKEALEKERANVETLRREADEMEALLQEARGGMAMAARKHEAYTDKNWMLATELSVPDRAAQYMYDNTVSARDCAQACADRADCAAMTWGLTTNACMLYRDVRRAAKHPAQDSDSWVKHPADLANARWSLKPPEPPAAAGAVAAAAAAAESDPFLLTATPSPASPATAVCVDVEGNSRGAGGRIHMWQCHKDQNQQWVYDAGTKRISSRLSDLCMDVSSSEDQAAVVQNPCGNANSQRFDLRAVGDRLEIRPQHVTGRCLDVRDMRADNGTDLTMNVCTGRPNQLFKRVPV
jgi:predicted  nucleic acid-binding Zn-ribbon protein